MHTVLRVFLFYKGSGHPRVAGIQPLILTSFSRAGSDDDCMDAGGRATQEQLPTTPYLIQIVTKFILISINPL